MKKKFTLLIGIFIGLILSFGIGIYAASEVFANQIKYKNGTVESALNDLYDKVPSNGNIALSINQTISLTTSYTSTTSPVFYDSNVLSYNSSTNTYTFLKDFNGRLYISQGWVNGATASKMKVQVNGVDVIAEHHFENTTSAFYYSYKFKKDDTLKFFSKFDVSNSKQVPISIILI